MTLLGVCWAFYQMLQFGALTDGPLQRLQVSLLRQLDAAVIHRSVAPRKR